MITLELEPHVEKDGQHHDRFDAWLDGELLLTSRQPLYDGARALLARGVDPTTLLTMRHRGKAYDSTRPLAIELLAELTVEESQRGLRLRKWRPLVGGRLQDARGTGETVLGSGVRRVPRVSQASSRKASPAQPLLSRQEALPRNAAETLAR